MQSNKEHNTVYRKDYRPFSHIIERVELDFNLDPESTHVTTTMTVAPRQGAHTTDLVLDGEDLFFEKILIDGKTVPNDRWKLELNSLTIRNVSTKTNITILNTFSPQANLALSGIYMSNGTFMSQCEAQGSRRITNWPDCPDCLSRFTVTMHADKTLYPVLLSNGNLIDQGDEDEGRHWVRWEDPFPQAQLPFCSGGGQLCMPQPDDHARRRKTGAS